MSMDEEREEESSFPKPVEDALSRSTEAHSFSRSIEEDPRWSKVFSSIEESSSS